MLLVTMHSWSYNPTDKRLVRMPPGYWSSWPAEDVRASPEFKSQLGWGDGDCICMVRCCFQRNQFKHNLLQGGREYA